MMKDISCYNIISMDGFGITFKNGDHMLFSDCAGRDSRYSEKCVGERNALADPPYIEFFTPGGNIRVVFNKTGILEKKKNQKYFGKFHIDIQEYGFTTFDLS